MHRSSCFPFLCGEENFSEASNGEINDLKWKKTKRRRQRKSNWSMMTFIWEVGEGVFCQLRSFTRWKRTLETIPRAFFESWRAGECHVGLWQCSTQFDAENNCFSTFFYTCVGNCITKMSSGLLESTFTIAGLLFQPLIVFLTLSFNPDCSYNFISHPDLHLRRHFLWVIIIYHRKVINCQLTRMQSVQRDSRLADCLFIHRHVSSSVSRRDFDSISIANWLQFKF